MPERFVPSVWTCLRRPRQQLQAFVREAPPNPWKAWAGFFVIAVFGSLLYGASLSLVLPGVGLREGALWILLAAGLGWMVFGPVLVWLSGQRLATCAQACMVTMAYGEGVLALGALLNVTIFLLGGSALASYINLGVILTANLVMGAALAAQLAAVGLPPKTTWAAWLFALNGSGALFFWWLRP